MFIERVINDERFKYLKKVIIKMYKNMLLWKISIGLGFEDSRVRVPGFSCQKSRQTYLKFYRLFMSDREDFSEPQHKIAYASGERQVPSNCAVPDPIPSPFVEGSGNCLSF